MFTKSFFLSHIVYKAYMKKAKNENPTLWKRIVKKKKLNYTNFLIQYMYML